MKNIPTIIINNPNKPININVPNTGITGNKFTDWSGSNNNFIQSSNNSSNNLGKFNVPNINAPNVHHSTQHHKPSSFNNHGIDVQRQYGDAFNNIQPAAQEILARQNHEPWDNPCLSTVVHMINKRNPFAFYQFQEHLEHRFDHPVHYSHTLDFSNFPALSGITKCGDHVTSNIAHWINLKSTGQLGKNVGNKVFSNFNTMKFNHNNIGDDAVEPILNSLSYQTLNLTTLKLSHNHLGDGFVKLFLNATSKDNGRAEHSIKNIVLHHNFIGDDGAMMFADALKSGQLPNTKYIDVSGNKISDKGAGTIAEALKTGKFPTLKRFDVSGNDISLVGEKFMLDALKHPSTQSVILLLKRSNDLKIVFSGSKEEKQKLVKETLQTAQDNGVDVKNVAVSKSMYEKIVNFGKIIGNFTWGFVKCNIVPEDAETFAMEAITAKISKKAIAANTAKDAVVCFFDTIDEVSASLEGIQLIKDLDLVGANSIIDSIE